MCAQKNLGHQKTWDKKLGTQYIFTLFFRKIDDVIQSACLSVSR